MRHQLALIVYPFQQVELTTSQIEYINDLREKHHQIAFAILINPVPGTRSNPLSFSQRRAMLTHHFPNNTPFIFGVKLQREPAKFTEELDAAIRQYFPFTEVVIYGTDHMVDLYRGKCHVHTADVLYHYIGHLRDVATVSASSGTPEFLRGVVCGAWQRYRHVISTVDVAIIRKEDSGTKLLLGRKPGEEKWRFVGGFAEPGSGGSDGMDVIREVEEETSLRVDINQIHFVGRYNVKDWRMSVDASEAFEGDSIRTSLYAAFDVKGEAVAGDDLEEVQWFNFRAVTEALFVEEHKHLWKALWESYRESIR